MRWYKGGCRTDNSFSWFHYVESLDFFREKPILAFPVFLFWKSIGDWNDFARFLVFGQWCNCYDNIIIETVVLTESAKSFLKIFLDFVAFSPVFDIFGTWHLLYYHCHNVYHMVMVMCICITRGIKRMVWSTSMQRVLCKLLFQNGIFVMCVCAWHLLDRRYL